MGESRNNPKVFIFGQSKTLVKYYLISRYIYTHVDHGANLTQSQSGPKTLQSGEFSGPKTLRFGGVNVTS